MALVLEVKKLDWGYSVDLPPKEGYHTLSAHMNPNGELFLERTFGQNGFGRSPYVAVEINKDQYRFEPDLLGVENKARPGTFADDAFEMLLKYVQQTGSR